MRLYSGSGGSTNRGLVIQNFTGDANGSFGVYVTTNATGTVIGGTTAGAGNVMAGNTNHGVYMDGAQATGNRIEGNIIGSNTLGTTGLGNGQGIWLMASVGGNNTIGGTSAGLEM